jgi:ribosome-binding protein aMBF1 (putative translation factor)
MENMLSILEEVKFTKRNKRNNMNATEQAREITNQIIAEAKRRNLTAGQLELKWGVTKSYVSVIMRGQRVPYLGTLDRIAKAMGIKDQIKIG